MAKTVLGGKLTVAKRESDGSYIASELYSTYPVRLQVTSRPDDYRRGRANPMPLRCYILDFGGGLVSGDTIRLHFHIKPGALATITSQSTTKAFKSIAERPDTYLRTCVTIEDRALLALVPQPIQCYNQSKLHQETTITLSYSSGTHVGSSGFAAPSLLYVDWYTGGGRNFDNGNWKFNSFHTCTELNWFNTDSGKTLSLFKDQSILTGGDELCRHMRSFNVICLVLLVGPRVANVAAKLLNDFSSRNHYEASSSPNDQHGSHTSRSHGHNRGIGLNHSQEQLLVSCGSFPLLAPESEGNKGVLLRIAAGSIEQAASLLSCYIGDLDGQLEDDPFMDILTTHQVLKTTPKPLVPKDDSAESLLSYGLLEFPSRMEDESSPMEEDLLKGSSDPLVPAICLHQLVDSSSPTGGFAHSNTLEAACQLHLINEHYSLLDHAWDILLQTTTTMIPFLIRSCQIFQESERASSTSSSTTWDVLIDEWETIDKDLSVSLTSHVNRRASCVQGSGILRAFGGVYSQIRDQVQSLRSRINTDSSSTGSHRGQAATCFGAVCGLLRVSPEQAANMFMYTVARDTINAGVRLNLIGPIEGGHFIQVMCHKISVVLDKFYFRSNVGGKGKLSWEMLQPCAAAHQVAPLLEILANAHDRLYSRLFNS